MKKFVLLVAAVLATLSLQAVTTAWSSGSFVAGHTYEIKIVLTATGDTMNTILGSTNKIVQLNGADSTALAVDIKRPSAWNFAALVNPNDVRGNYYDAWKIPTGNLETITLAFKGTGTADGKLSNFFFNYEESVGDTGYQQTTYWGWNTATVGEISSIDLFDGYEGDTTGVTMTASITNLSIPEPTVLALLAMGVASLALRRKQA